MRTLYKKIKKKSKYYSPKKHHSHQKTGRKPARTSLSTVQTTLRQPAA